jgi:hypothetical protein
MRLLQKLQLKAGQKLNVLNAPPAIFKALAEDIEGIEVVEGMQGQSDAVLLFVNTMAEALDLFPSGIAAVKPDGLFWVAYPKQTSKVPTDVNRDRLWEAVADTGWRPVRMVAMDEVWSAMRFRPADKVGKS